MGNKRNGAGILTASRKPVNQLVLTATEAAGGQTAILEQYGEHQGGHPDERGGDTGSTKAQHSAGGTWSGGMTWAG